MFTKAIPRRFASRNSGGVLSLLSNSVVTTNNVLYIQQRQQQYATETSSAPIDHTIGYQLSLNVKKAPFANAFRSSHQQISWSFSEVRRHIEAFACGVTELGLRPGDNMLLYGGSSAEQIVAMGACAKAGAALVQAPQIKNEEELSRYLELFKPRIIVTPLKYQNTDMYKLLKKVFPDLQHREDSGETFSPIKSKKHPYCRHILLLENDMADQKSGTHLFLDALVYGPFGYYENPLRRIAMRMTPDDPVLILLNDKDIQTARPMAFSHRSLLNAGQQMAQKAGIKQGDRVVVTHHQQSPFGALANYACVVSRATLVFPTLFFDAKECLKQIDAEQATVVFGSADDLKELIDVKESSDLKLEHLKTVVVDSSVSSELISKIKESFSGVNVVQASGIDGSSESLETKQ